MYGANDSLDALGGNSAAPAGGGSGSGTAAGGYTGNGTPQGAMAASALNGGSGGGGGGSAGINLGTQTTNTASNGSPTTSSAQGQFSNFYNSPGYQFALQQGQQAVSRGAAASGNLYSTNTLNQLDTNAQGYASQQYNNYVNQLMGLAGYGATGVSASSNAATTAGNNISANQLSAGNAQASGILGQAGAYSGAISNTTGLLGNYGVISGLKNGNSLGLNDYQNQMSGIAAQTANTVIADPSAPVQADTSLWGP